MLPLALANLVVTAVLLWSLECRCERSPYRRKRYWNEPTHGAGGSGPTSSRSCAGSRITGARLPRATCGSWMTGRKGALTTYYPEETRADYSPINRGKHVLTQRPDGRPQCVACNLCATVCPAKVHRDRGRRSTPTDPRIRSLPMRFEIDYSRCIFCGLCVEACPEDAIRMVKDVPDLPAASIARPCGSASRSCCTWHPQRESPSPIRRRRRVARRRHDRACSTSLHRSVCSAASALVWRALVLVLRQPMRVALALIATMVILAAIYGLLGVHVVAAFQVLIYVGAVMVFMVYAIMLLDVRDASLRARVLPLLGARGDRRCGAGRRARRHARAVGACRARRAPPASRRRSRSRPSPSRSSTQYWFHFELASVLLVVGVVAAWR